MLDSIYTAIVLVPALDAMDHSVRKYGSPAPAAAQTFHHRAMRSLPLRLGRSMTARGPSGACTSVCPRRRPRFGGSMKLRLDILPPAQREL
jgi:hypothetical protein